MVSASSDLGGPDFGHLYCEVLALKWIHFLTKSSLTIKIIVVKHHQ